MKNIGVLSVFVVAGFMATFSVALAADPTQADFDACNQMAQSKVSSPSASPQTQTDVKSAPSTSAPQAARSPQTATQARVETQASQLRGITDASKDDPAYQQAYRDCMKGRGF